MLSPTTADTSTFDTSSSTYAISDTGLTVGSLTGGASTSGSTALTSPVEPAATDTAPSPGGIANFKALTPSQLSLFLTADAASCKNTLLTHGSCGLSMYFAGKFDETLPCVAMPMGTVMGQFGEAQHNQLCGSEL